MSQGMARQGARIAAAALIGVGLTCAIAADNAVVNVQPAPVVTKAAADSDKPADGSPTPWVLALAGVGVVGWAARRRLGQR
jgi:MYXO-CTERM domain-containing protein